MDTIPNWMRGDSRLAPLVKAIDYIETTLKEYQAKTITWYTDNVGGHATHDDVIDPREGDMFLYTQSGDLRQYIGGQWIFLATLNTNRPG